MENGLLNHVVGREGSYVPNSRDAVPGRERKFKEASINMFYFLQMWSPAKILPQYIQPTIIEYASEDRFMQALIYGKLDECKNHAWNGIVTLITL